jgi:tetratricopeptide (TPR) repeat protein
MMPGKAPTYGPTPPTVEPASTNKGPLKNETIVTFADAQVSAVFDTAAEGLGVQGERTLEEARYKYQHVLQTDPTNREALVGMARLYTRLGDRERATAFYESATKAHPRDHKLLYERSLALGRFEDWNGAMQSCQQALALDPENRRYRKTLGIATARTGQMEKGFEILNSVMNEAEARYTMARVLVDGQRPELVVQQLQLASAVDPNFAPAQQWLSELQGATGGPQTADYREAMPGK